MTKEPLLQLFDIHEHKSNIEISKSVYICRECLFLFVLDPYITGAEEVWFNIGPKFGWGWETRH